MVWIVSPIGELATKWMGYLSPVNGLPPVFDAIFSYHTEIAFTVQDTAKVILFGIGQYPAANKGFSREWVFKRCGEK